MPPIVLSGEAPVDQATSYSTPPTPGSIAGSQRSVTASPGVRSGRASRNGRVGGEPSWVELASSLTFMLPAMSTAVTWYQYVTPSERPDIVIDVVLVMSVWKGPLPGRVKTSMM
jgi:hypothetical protein